MSSIRKNPNLTTHLRCAANNEHAITDLPESRPVSRPDFQPS